MVSGINIKMYAPSELIASVDIFNKSLFVFLFALGIIEVNAFCVCLQISLTS